MLPESPAPELASAASEPSEYSDGSADTLGPAVCVIGTGLLGTSVALALSRAGREVWLRDIDSEALQDAVALGAGCPWPSGSEADTPVPDANQVGLVVVAVPPSQVASVIIEALDAFPVATVTDVSSVKCGPLTQVRAGGADASRVVGGHPLAGREKSGARAATADLFHDRPWVLTPLPQTGDDALAAARQMVDQVGAVLFEMTPEDHDRAVALTSHTPQIIASVLAGQLADHDDRDVSVSGQGLRDVTRIAESDPALWTEILVANADEVRAVLEPIVAELSAVVGMLTDTDAAPAAGAQRLTDVLVKGNRGRARVPAKHGGAEPTYEPVQVLIADEPGQLGRLFAAAGEAGINLEDVRIEHSLGRLTAVVDLLVRPESAPALRAALAGAGWQLSN